MPAAHLHVVIGSEGRHATFTRLLRDRAAACGRRRARPSEDASFRRGDRVSAGVMGRSKGHGITFTSLACVMTHHHPESRFHSTAARAAAHAAGHTLAPWTRVPSNRPRRTSRLTPRPLPPSLPRTTSRGPWLPLVGLLLQPRMATTMTMIVTVTMTVHAAHDHVWLHGM